jgi:cytochrome b561
VGKNGGAPDPCGVLPVDDCHAPVGLGDVLSLFGGKPMLLFGLIPWPSLPGLAGGDEAAQKALAKQFYELHELLANALWLLLALHVGAALIHHFWRRDEVLLRMTPRWSAPLLRRLRGESD